MNDKPFPPENQEELSPVQEAPQEAASGEEQAPPEDFRRLWLEAVAEGQNIRKRCEKEKDEQIQYAIFRFAQDLVSVAENLERALASIPAERQHQEFISALYQGVVLTHQELAKTFQKFGVMKMDNLVGQKFDPHRHQVMFEKEEDSCAPGTIVEVLQAGYMLNERLLKPAFVGVSKKPSAPSSSE